MHTGSDVKEKSYYLCVEFLSIMAFSLDKTCKAECLVSGMFLRGLEFHKPFSIDCM